MFMEMLAAEVLDPMSECPCGRDDHRRTNCPDDMPMAPIGTLPSVPPSVNHLIKKSINGKRITLHHVRPDGKGHYIGLPGVMVPAPDQVEPIYRALVRWRDALNDQDQNDIGRKAP